MTKEHAQYELNSIMKPRNIIISIKPQYAQQIVNGTKTIELRRKFPTEHIEGGIAIIYASSPICQIIGYARIDKVSSLSITTLWQRFGKASCVTKSFFNDYFSGLESGFAITLTNPVKLKTPLDIKRLEGEYSFSPPQSYRYASERILQAVEV